jgi:hypothetical protein
MVVAFSRPRARLNRRADAVHERAERRTERFVNRNEHDTENARDDSVFQSRNGPTVPQQEHLLLPKLQISLADH